MKGYLIAKTYAVWNVLHFSNVIWYSGKMRVDEKILRQAKAFSTKNPKAKVNKQMLDFFMALYTLSVNGIGNPINPISMNTKFVFYIYSMYNYEYHIILYKFCFTQELMKKNGVF